MSDTGSILTMRYVLETFASKYGSSEKLIFPDEDVRLTAAAFDEELNRLANGYLRLGLRPGDRVGFVGLNSRRFVCAFFATMKAGLVPTIFNPRESPERLRILADRFDPEFLVTDPGHEAKREAIRSGSAVEGSVVLRDEPEADSDQLGYGALQSAATDAPDVDVTADDTLLVSWSTGTTGVPKGAVWSNEGMVLAGNVNAEGKGLRPADCLVNKYTPGFQAWLYNTIPNILRGTSMVFLPEFDPERYLETVEAEGATFLSAVPTQYRMLLDADIESYDLSSVRAGIFGGEQMSEEVLRELQETVTPTFFSIYSSTEATVVSGLVDRTYERKHNALGGGPSLVDVRAVRRPESGPPSPDDRIDRGEVGELVVKTPGRAERILDDPEQTAATFRDGWWFTGDMVRKDEDGDLFVVGRTDDMIISGGINIYPNAVEDVLMEHPGVKETVVVGTPSEKWGQAVTAVVRTDGAVTPDELDDHCLESPDIPRHARPRSYILREEPFPRTPTGKIYREGLREELGDEGDR
jgi:long-chain acyl-CoA synthetase